MKYKNIYMGCFATLLISSSAFGLTTPKSGQDNRVEWAVQQNWSTADKALDMVHSLDGKLVYLLNDKSQVQVYTNKGKLQGSIPVKAGTTAIDIAPRGETLYLINNKDMTFSSVSVSFVVDLDTSGAPFKGLANAPVTMTVFTDFE